MPTSVVADAPWPTYLGSSARFGVGFSSPALDSIKQTWSSSLDANLYGNVFRAEREISLSGPQR